MKSRTIILSAILVVIASVTTFAQGNLQFNSVLRQQITLTTTLNQNYPEATASVVVPVGQVYKIESASVMNTYFSSYTYKSPYGALYLDGTILFDNAMGNSTSSNQPSNEIFPVWLGPGTYTLTVRASCTSCNSGQTFVGTIRGLIFNVIP